MTNFGRKRMPGKEEKAETPNRTKRKVIPPFKSCFDLKVKNRKK